MPSKEGFIMCLQLDKKMPDILKEARVLLMISKAGKYSVVSDSDDFGIFSRAYLFTNENIRGYYEFCIFRYKAL